MSNKRSNEQKSTLIRLIVLVAIVLGIIVINLIITGLNPPEVTIWAPGPNWGYETPHELV